MFYFEGFQKLSCKRGFNTIVKVPRILCVASKLFIFLSRAILCFVAARGEICYPFSGKPATADCTFSEMYVILFLTLSISVHLIDRK